MGSGDPKDPSSLDAGAIIYTDDAACMAALGDSIEAISASYLHLGASVGFAAE